MKLTIVAGARPNFMKIAPIIHEIDKINKNKLKIDYDLIHTGQHYDKNMSSQFFKDLGIPKPLVNLKSGSGTQAQITAKIMVQFEKFLLKNKSDLVLVVGDVTSTMACSIVAQKLQIKVAHVEGGIRSNDWKMPEEINRLITDSISNYFFTTSETANNNLISSGVNKKNIFFVGNTMIDTLIKNLSRLKKPKIWDQFGLKNGNYIVVTLHRPSNVDEIDKLKEILDKITENSESIKIIFPVHPRTKRNISNSNLENHKLKLIDPLPYLEFNYLVKNSLAVITDSGGITEETTFMGIPCVTLRDSTERPETVTIGTNELIGSDPKLIPATMKKLIYGNWKQGKVPKYWDGKTSKRIIKIIDKIFN